MQPDRRAWMLLTALALVISLCAGAARADVLYTNLGAGDAFDAETYLAFPDASVAVAAPFTVTGGDYVLSSIELALSGASLDVYLYTDAGGLPGTRIETLKAGTLTSTPQLVTISSPYSRVPLSKGVTYWVVATWGTGSKWYRNNTGTLGVGSRNSFSSPWVYSDSETDRTPAFRVSGNPVLPATALASPAGSSEAVAVNTFGQSAGIAIGANGDWSACLWTGGSLTFLDTVDNGVLDNARISYADKINSKGQVLGDYTVDYQKYRTFLWTPAPDNGITGAMVDIGVVLPGDDGCQPTDLNDAGQVLAASFGPPYYEGEPHSFVWTKTGDSVVRDPLTWDEDGITKYIDVTRGDMNNNGQVVGTVSMYSGVNGAVLWKKAGIVPEVTVLRDSGNNPVRCLSAVINDAGQVAGRGSLTGGYLWFYSPGEPVKTLNLIGTYPAYTDLSSAQIKPVGISNNGHVLILAGTHMFVWQDDGSDAGVFTEIPISGWVLPDAAGSMGSMNASGQVAGYVNNNYNMDKHGFFWDPAEPQTVRELGVLPKCYNPYAMAISDAGLIAGYCADTAGYYRASTWNTAPSINHPPVLSGVPTSPTIDEMAPYTFTAAATDADGDPLTFSLSGAPALSTIDSATGVFTWTPAEDQGPWSYTFTVVVSDGTDTDSQDITINVNEVNQAPVLNDPGSRTVDEEQHLSFQLVANDPDDPTQPLTYSATVMPTGMSIDPGSGTIYWKPTEEQGPGDYSVTAAVSDGTLSSSVTFAVHVNEVNQAPILDISSAPATGIVGTPVTFTAAATDPDIPTNDLTFSLGETAPTGATIAPTTGVFSWTPSAAGTFTFDVTVTDDGWLYDTESVTITVPQSQSALNIGTATLTKKGKTVTITVKAALSNPNTQAALDTFVRTATLNGVAPSTSLPLKVGTVRANASKTISLQFKDVAPGSATLSIAGDCSLGEFYGDQSVNVPQ